MDITASVKYIRISPKKIRELAHSLVGFTPDEAIRHLQVTQNKAAGLLNKAIASAKANAVNNHKLNAGSLKIKTIETGKGPFFKRWQPVSRGMAHSIKKRTSHIKVVLTQDKKEQK